MRLQLGRNSESYSSISIMSKPPGTMHCAVCRRPLSRAAALLKGQPVGPVCAASKGLTKPRAAAPTTGDLFAVPVTQAAPFRDTLTIDMFAV